MTSFRYPNALSLLRLECKRGTMAESIMVLKYLLNVLSVDEYLMIVRKGFYSLVVLKL
jgi:hypothetical protein